MIELSLCLIGFYFSVLIAEYLLCLYVSSLFALFPACMDEPLIHLEDIYTTGIAAALCSPLTAHISISSRIVNAQPPNSVSPKLMDTNKYLIVHRIAKLMEERLRENRAQNVTQSR